MCFSSRFLSPVRVLSFQIGMGLVKPGWNFDRLDKAYTSCKQWCTFTHTISFPFSSPSFPLNQTQTQPQTSIRYTRVLMCHIVANLLRLYERVGFPKFNALYVRNLLLEDSFHNILFVSIHSGIHFYCTRMRALWVEFFEYASLFKEVAGTSNTVVPFV